MTEADNEAAFLSSMQAMNESAGGYSNTGDASGEQIDSQDEYDPAQDVSMSGPSNPDLSNQVSSSSSSNNSSRPTSAQEHVPQVVPASNSVQTEQVKSPSGAVQTAAEQASVVARPSSTAATANIANPPTTSMPKARLPHDRIGILEDRIKEDPKGDTDAWLSLIEEHKARGKLDDAKKVYERFLVVFPQAAEVWVTYSQMQNEAGNKAAVEDIFSRKLADLASLSMWSMYLGHIRRYFNMATDKSGNASQVNHAAYEAVLEKVGIDKDAGQLWLDYIAFIKSSPGTVGGTSWQDQQKMDLLRKAYQQAICIPTQSVETIWKEYSAFETGLNKLTGRKFLQERSPEYMSARGSYVELQNITRDLRRTTVPTLPPAFGFEGDVEYTTQVEIWKRWIEWEKNDPLVLKSDNATGYKARVIYAYKQALMALWFWPEMWFEAAEFCFENDLESDGDKFLSLGIEANPESCLLAFKQADKLEMSTTNGNDEDSKQQRGIKVRAPYNVLLDALYALVESVTNREKNEIARVEAEFAETAAEGQFNGTLQEEDDEGFNRDDENSEANKKTIRIRMIKTMHSVQIKILNRTISHAWIALMRAMQRMQGKGKPGAKIGGSRQVFTDARKRGRITSEVWAAAALLEYHNSDSESAKRIFENGLKRYPDDDSFALEYIKLLTSTNDNTNARVVFEKSVDRLLQNPETALQAKPLFQFFHLYEAQYGELSQVVKLEKRMQEAFPDDPKLFSFSQRYRGDKFDPTAIRPLISPAVQARPKLPPPPKVEESVPTPVPAPAVVSIEAPTPIHPTPAIPTPPTNYAVPAPLPVPNPTNSPKRPLPLDDFNTDINPPRKLARGESPLAGAAGRRLNQAKQNRQPYDTSQSATPGAGYSVPPPPIPRDVLFLLSIIPPASTYSPSMIIPPEAVVRLMRETNLPGSASQLPPRPPPVNVPQAPPQSYPPMPQGQFQGHMSYLR